MLRDLLKEILDKKKVSNYQVWKKLGINQGQLSCFFNGKKSMSLKNLERIADLVGYGIIPVIKEGIKKEPYKKRSLNVREAVKIAEREIEERIEKFESTCPGYFVEAVDGPPIKLHLHQGGIGVVSTKGRDEPDSKQKSEKPRKYRY